MMQFEENLRGKRIFVTGHSGFTGSWLCTWFQHCGAEVFGYSLPPENEPSLAMLLGLTENVPEVIADIMDYDRLAKAMGEFKPDVVIHLAAQPLVRRSYREPLRTFAVNALGTANVLEAARMTPGLRAVVCITTDKVYENREWEWAYRENDPIGGKDPYSASKAAAEMVIKGYAASFSAGPEGLLVATARGGNIIGGGDWSEDRLVPDFVRAVATGGQLTLRYPDATRPWQHVLALVQGYGQLAAGLLSDTPEPFARAWNLGPSELQPYSVRSVLETLSAHWKRPDLVYLDEPLPEAGALALDSRLAYGKLGWQAPWSIEEMIKKTAEWYKAYHDRAANGTMGAGSMRDVTLDQINAWRGALAGTAAG